MTAEGYVLTSGHATGLEADLVREVAGVMECYAGQPVADVAAHALLAARAWRERQAARERGHARLRDDKARRSALADVL